MTRWLLSILFALSATAQPFTLLDGSFLGAAQRARQVVTPATTNTGDIIYAEVADNGWRLNLVCHDMVTNGTYVTGFTNTAFNVTDYAKVIVTVSDAGFTQAGAATTYARQIYGTWPIRKAYPNQAYIDETDNGGTVTIPIALSRQIWSSSSSITVSIAEGLYDDGATSTASASLSVVNNSEIPVPVAAANWTCVPFRVITNNSLKLSMVAAAHGATNGCPVACVKFRATDGSTSVTNTVTGMTLDPDMASIDAIPFAEYWTNLDLSGMTDNALISCDFTVYPWIGAAFDSAGYATWPTLNPCTHTNIHDPDLDYGTTRAIVDIATGNDATGVAATQAYWDTNQTPQAFATIGRAIAAISGTNNTFYSRAEPGNGIVLLAAQNHNYLGSALTLANNCSTWVHIVPLSGTPVITNYATDNRGKDDSDKIRLYGIDYDGMAAAGYAHQRQHVWHDQCRILNVGFAGGLFYSDTSVPTSWYITGCTWSNYPLALRAQSSNLKTEIALVRGNVFTNFDNPILATTFVGNRIGFDNTTDDDATLITDTVSQGWSHSRTPIIYNNVVVSGFAGGSMLSLPLNFALTNGALVANNVFESTEGQDSRNTWEVGTANFNATNAMLWHNTWTGTKTDFAYNWDDGGTPYYRVNFSLVGNLMDEHNTKSDTTGAANSGHVGNWPYIFGVGWDGNVDLAVTNMQAWSSHINDDGPLLGFHGVRSWSYYTAVSVNGSTTNYPAFTDRKSYDGWGVATAGNGTYSLEAGSPLLDKGPGVQVLPYDIAGNPRSLGDPPGAYAAP